MMARSLLASLAGLFAHFLLIFLRWLAYRRGHSYHLAA